MNVRPPRVFNRIVLAMIAPALLAIVAVNAFHAFKSEHADYRSLLSYQLAKLENAGQAQVLFVGDSSCGNAIDAKYLSKLFEVGVVNAALNGSFGYAGSYNMVRRAIEKMPALRLVVVMQTVDMPARPVSWDGYLLTLGDPGQVSELTPKQATTFIEETMQGLFSFSRFRSALSRIGRKVVTPDPDVDYMVQGPKAIRLHQDGISAPIVSEQAAFLRKISDFCAARGIVCIYAYGPTYGPVAEHSVDFLRSSRAFITEAGIKTIVGPVKLKEDQVGDTEDHAAPESKREVTAAYAEWIKPFMAGTAGRAGSLR